MQNLTLIPESERISASRVRLERNFETLQSNFSGESFPSLLLQEGQHCYLTSSGELYVLTSTNPNVWELLFKKGSIVVDKEYVDSVDSQKIDKAGGTFTGAVNCTTPPKGIVNKRIVNMEALDEALRDKADIDGLSQVAYDNSYTSLDNRPTLHKVSASGKYGDLDDKPQFATKAEAETATNTTTIMSPQRVREAIAKLVVIPSHGVQTFTSSGTFVVPAGVTKVWLTGVGGGGGGNGSSSWNEGDYDGYSPGRAGNSGRVAIGVLVNVSPGTSVPVTIGAGGNRGTSSGYEYVAGKPGGATSFGGYLSVAGGSGVYAGGSIPSSNPFGVYGGGGFGLGGRGQDGKSGASTNGSPGFLRVEW